jgi:hypothetical protein
VGWTDRLPDDDCFGAGDSVWKKELRFELPDGAFLLVMRGSDIRGSVMRGSDIRGSDMRGSDFCISAIELGPAMLPLLRDLVEFW